MENPYVKSQLTSLQIIAQAEYLKGEDKKLAVEAVEWRLKNGSDIIIDIKKIMELFVADPSKPYNQLVEEATGKK